MIRKVSGGYIVVSEKGRPLSSILPSRKAAEARLAQVEFFKNKGKRRR